MKGYVREVPLKTAQERVSTSPPEERLVENNKILEAIQEIQTEVEELRGLMEEMK